MSASAEKGLYTILIVEDDIDFAMSVEMLFSSRGHKVVIAHDGFAGIEKAKELHPDLVILDFGIPGIDGFNVCHKLREIVSTRFIPIMMLTGTKTYPTDRITGLKIGADDYLLKPPDMEELYTRAMRLIERAQDLISINPLTKLPGNYSIESEAIRRINNGLEFAICYLDIDHFKAYNDCYGYTQGDQVIHTLSLIIISAIRSMGNMDDFIGHIGGDDFIFLTSIDKVENICAQIVNMFDNKVQYFYNEEDYKKGYITTKDRRGNIQHFPLMRLSIVVTDNRRHKIKHYGQLVEILAALKQYVKTLPNRNNRSIYFVDRRTDTA